MKQRTRAQISYNMSRIKSSGSKIERVFAKELTSAGIKFRKNYKYITGKPDFVIAKNKIAVFCDSAFWHGYRRMSTSRHKFKTKRAFWRNKIYQNIKRDKTVNALLKKEGWRVIRLWDFQILKDVDKCTKKVLKEIK